MESLEALVRLSPAGHPIAIRAAGRDFIAAGRPDVWMDRRRWWAGTAASRLGAAALERERWSVPSVDEQGNTVVIELEHDRSANRWSLLPPDA